MPTNMVLLSYACVQLLAILMCVVKVAYTYFSCLALIIKKDAL